MDRTQLLGLVERICDDDDLSESALNDLVATFCANIPHPAGSDLLYYPENWGLSEDASPKEIVDFALRWEPKIVSANILRVRPHPSRSDLRCFEVEVPNLLLSQVVGRADHGSSERCILALSGVSRSGGVKVKHRFIDGAFTIGELLGSTTEEVGHEFGCDAPIGPHELTT